MCEQTSVMLLTNRQVSIAGLLEHCLPCILRIWAAPHAYSPTYTFSISCRPQANMSFHTFSWKKKYHHSRKSIRLTCSFGGIDREHFDIRDTFLPMILCDFCYTYLWALYDHWSGHFMRAAATLFFETDCRTPLTNVHSVEIQHYEHH